MSPPSSPSTLPPSTSNGSTTTPPTGSAKLTSALPSVAELPSIPTIDDAPPAQKAKSHLLLVALVVGLVVGGWFAGFDLLQVARQNSWLELAALLGAFAAAMVALLHWVGLASIDFWELVHGYWWLFVPVVAAAALFTTMAQEKATSIQDVE